MMISAMLAGALALGSCEGLKSKSAPDITVTAAEIVAAGPAEAAGPGGGARGRGGAAAPAGRGGTGRGSATVSLPEYCRVAAVLRPSTDSHIEMELWMPAENWNGKFLAIGNGGYAGSISLGDMADGLQIGRAHV